MKLVVLGAGAEADFFVRTFFREFNIVAYGPHRLNVAAAQNTMSFCAENGIPLLRDLDDLEGYQPDYVFMASYPALIANTVLDRFRFINMHGALVPSYRGMHGGTWALVNGERYHGYTLHQVDSGIDSGPVYYQGRIEADLSDDINTIRAKILQHFKAHAGEAFRSILSGRLQPVPQDDALASYVCRRTPEDSRIDWGQTAWNVFNLIRALTPPYAAGAFTYYRGERLYLTKGLWLESPAYVATVGQVVARLPGRGVLVKCQDRPLLISRIIYRGEALDPNDLFKTVGARLKDEPEAAISQ
jgi:methionyl-tRNA formyltransferase